MAMEHSVERMLDTLANCSRMSRSAQAFQPSLLLLPPTQACVRTEYKQERAEQMLPLHPPVAEHRYSSDMSGHPHRHSHCPAEIQAPNYPHV